MPGSRITGNARTAPTAAATAAPISIARRTAMPVRLTSCAVVNAPIAANVAWQSEMVPPTPVIITIDSSTTARQVPPTKIASHSWSNTNQQRRNTTTVTTTPNTRVAIVIQRGRSSAAGAGGGGSTPASGSDT